MNNSAFSTISARLQLAWDSTSMSLFKECPRKYYYAIILGYTPRAMSVHLAFGLHYHAALEAYDYARAKGASHEQATIVAVRRALRDTWNFELKRPWFSDDKYKNRYTLIRSVVWYLAKFEHDSLKTIILANGKPAVELSFRFQTTYVSSGGQPFVLCGHIDRLVTFGNMLHVLDRKSTKSTLDGDSKEKFFAQFSPHNQMSQYSFAGRVIYDVPVQGVIIDGVQVAIEFSRFERGIATRSEAQLDEWYEMMGYYLGRAEHCAKTGKWPMNELSCNAYGGCQFRRICNRSPEVRHEWLEREFVKRVWDPLVVRGDI